MNLGIFLFFIIIIFANVVIGYVIATLSGIGPRDLHAARSILGRILRFPNKSILNIPVAWAGWVVSKLASIIPIKALTKHQTPVPPSETTDEKLQKISEIKVDQFLDDESAEITRVTPIPELFDDNLMNIIFAQGTEAWQVNDKHIETSIHKLNLIMMASGQFAGELDEKLRAADGHATMDEVRLYCKNLADDCHNYLENQSKITEEIHSEVEEFGELKELADEVDQANLEQASQIETTLSNLEQLAKSDDAQHALECLVRELGNLRKARHNTRDIQDRVFFTLARYKNRMDSINRGTTFIDTATGLNNRIAFQTHLWEWWQQERQKKSKLTFALYDIVGFDDLNNKIGILKCDKLLAMLADFISQRDGNLDFIGMYTGNCLVSVSSNNGLRKAVAFVERIRQEIERTRFDFCDGEDGVAIRLTCAVTEALEKQTETQLMSTLEQTLTAAKNYGRNVVFMQDNTKLAAAPEPVESLELSVRDQVYNMKTMKITELETIGG